jgi:hypothetical protein
VRSGAGNCPEFGNVGDKIQNEDTQNKKHDTGQHGIQDTRRRQTSNTICGGHHYM